MQCQAISGFQLDRLHGMHLIRIDPRCGTHERVCLMRCEVEDVVPARIPVALHGHDGAFTIPCEARKVSEFAWETGSECLSEARFFALRFEEIDRFLTVVCDDGIVVLLVRCGEKLPWIGIFSLVEEAPAPGFQIHQVDRVWCTFVADFYIEFVVVAVESDRAYAKPGFGGVIENFPGMSVAAVHKGVVVVLLESDGVDTRAELRVRIVLANGQAVIVKRYTRTSMMIGNDGCIV